MSDEPLGRRLRRERERRRITLESIASDTKIGVSLLHALESDDVSKLPAGIFRRSIVRSYAGAVGLDPDETLAEFLDHFPDPPDLTTNNVERLPGIARGRAPSRRRSSGGLRLTLADSNRSFPGGPLFRGAGRRLRAAAFDLGALTVLGTAAFFAVHQVWLVLAVVAVVYYTCGIVFLGTTPGALLLARHADDATESAPLGRSVFDELTIPARPSWSGAAGRLEVADEDMELRAPAARGPIMETLGSISGAPQG